MEFKTTEIIKDVYHLEFETQLDITSTLVRIQEHFESPRFKDKIFTLDEFKDWYTHNSPNGIKTGEFTYYTDWNGFNFPSYVLEPFRKGQFDPLSLNELKLLSFLDSKKLPYYVIGTHGEKPIKTLDTLRHELGHALYYTSADYKIEVTKVLQTIPSKLKTDISDYLLSTGGYHADVIEDEIHAHLLASLDKLQKKARLDISKYTNFSKDLNAIFQKYKG